MDQVVGTDGEAVSVAGDNHDVEFRACHLQPGGEGRRSAVGSVQRAEVHIADKAAAAADAGHHRKPVPVYLLFVDSF